MNIILIAPPLAGKGTQANKLRTKHNLVHISVGDLLRRELDNQGSESELISTLMNEGKLVDNSIITRLLKKRLLCKDVSRGFILDGYPRNMEQTLSYEEIKKDLNLKESIVILLETSSDVLLSRLEGRVVCKNCGSVYNTNDNSFKEHICNNCGHELTTRSDDNKETFKRRLEVYNKETLEVVNYYKQQGILNVIDANQTPEEVFTQIERVLK